jgi:hypothetical protein
MEPDGSGFILNRAIETRRRQGTLLHLNTPLSEKVPLLRAFSLSLEEVAKRAAAFRHAWRERPGVPFDLTPGSMNGYRPYMFMSKQSSAWHPTKAQQESARTQLPHRQKESFTRRRADSRRDLSFTYIKRSGYYAVFNAGTPISEQQRFGLGLVAHSHYVTFLQSQTGSESASWDTKVDGKIMVAEIGPLHATFVSEDPDSQIRPGVRDLMTQSLSIHYTIADHAKKALAFNADNIEVGIQASGTTQLTEVLPILLPFGASPQNNACCSGWSNGHDIGFFIQTDAASTWRKTESSVLHKTLWMLELKSLARLNYSIQILADY